jgi:hypothetical protein
MKKALSTAVLIAICITGCASSTPAPSPTFQPTATIASSSAPQTSTPIPPTPTPTPLRIWHDPAVPIAVRDQVMAALSSLDAVPAPSAEQSDLRIGLELPIELARWVYAIAAPFPTVTDEVKWDDVLRFWAGEPGALSQISEDGTSPTLFVTPETLGVLHGLLGASSAKCPLAIAEPDRLVDEAWTARPRAWAIIPFDELEPRWKVLRINGASVLDKGLDVQQYALAVSIGAEGDGADALASTLSGQGLLTNRAPEHMTVLMMTGVTALVRGIAHRMEEKGILYPAQRIGSLLRAADVLHISNEISFSEGCPTPDPRTESLTFCSNPRYIDLLRALDPDVIELTGNHVKDYGSQPMLDTLAMYCDEGWTYYGGGTDLEDARLPIIVKRNGTAFGFIGCNPVGPEYAWATSEHPGAAPCDYEYIHSELAKLKEQTDVPVATLQYWEFYQYEPSAQQRSDFRDLVEAGAAIVSGSQAHHPQAIEFYNGAFIHYGLGNLFFDQMWSLGTRQEFVDRHVIYQGRHISTELLTFMLEDYSQPRPMTAQERAELLQAVFEASGW